MPLTPSPMAEDRDAILCQRLEELANVSDQIRTAIEGGDDERARELLSLSQERLASVGEATRKVDSPPPAAVGQHALRRMQGFLERIRLGNHVVQAWLRGPPSERRYNPSTREGAARMADALLPEGWEKDRDMVLLVGSGGGPLARELLSRGQVRLFAYLPDGASGDDLPAQALVVRSLVEGV